MHLTVGGHRRLMQLQYRAPLPSRARIVHCCPPRSSVLLAQVSNLAQGRACPYAVLHAVRVADCVR